MERPANMTISIPKLRPRKVGNEDEKVVKDELKYLAEQHLLSFTQQAWDKVDPAQYMYNWHLRLICEYLMAVSTGRIKRLVINIPPRYSKSMLVSIMWPCWEWATINPSQKWVFASYAAILSSYMSMKRRDLIQSEWYQSFWGDRVSLKADYNRQADYLNNSGGMMFSTSTGGTLTGMGGNCLLGDTLVDTDSGKLFIQTLANIPQKPKVLAFNHETGLCEYRRVIAARRVKSDRILEIKTDSGNKIRATRDHRFYVAGCGYKRAKDLRRGENLLKVKQDMQYMWEEEGRSRTVLHGMLQETEIDKSSNDMLVLRQGVREANLRDQEIDKERVQGCLLFAGLLGKASCNQEREKMPALQETNARKEAQHVLLSEMSGRTQIGVERVKDLPNMRDSVLSQIQENPVLFQRMRRQSPLDENGRREQLSLQRRNELCYVVYPDESTDIGTRPAQMLGVPETGIVQEDNLDWSRGYKVEHVSSPHRQRSQEQSAGEPHNNVQRMPFHPPRLEEVTISSIEEVSCGEVDVYDIQVEGCHNFFADEILVHNCLVIDDPTNPQEALSEAAREQVNDWFFNTFLSRLDDKINGSIVLIQQRLHQRDLTGYLTGLDNSELDGYLHEKNGWTLVRVPLVAEMDEEYISPLDGRVIKRVHEGELLWSDREGPDQIEEKKRDIFSFEPQYQQRPSSKKGAIFNRDWFQYYEKMPLIPDTWIMSVDTTYKSSAGSDYVCIGMWAWKTPNMYLDYVVREKMSFTQCLQVIQELLVLYPATSAKLIEETANGDAIIDTLHTKIGGFIPIRPGESKVARAQAVTPYFVSKNVHVKMAPWTHDYIIEMVNFDGSSSTKVKKDDQVDMTTQAIDYMVHAFGGVQHYDEDPKAIVRLISRGRR